MHKNLASFARGKFKAHSYKSIKIVVKKGRFNVSSAKILFLSQRSPDMKRSVDQEQKDAIPVEIILKYDNLSHMQLLVD